MSNRRKFLVLRKMRQRVVTNLLKEAMRNTLDDDLDIPMLRQEDLYRDKVSASLH